MAFTSQMLNYLRENRETVKFEFPAYVVNGWARWHSRSFWFLENIFTYLFGCARAQLWHAGSFSCCMWDPVPWWGSDPGSLHCKCAAYYWTSREVPLTLKILQFLLLSKRHRTHWRIAVHPSLLAFSFPCQSCSYFSLLNPAPFLLISVMIAIILILIQPSCAMASP